LVIYLYGRVHTCNALQAAGVPFLIDSLPWGALLEEMEIRFIRLDGENSIRKIKYKYKWFLCAVPAGEVPCIFRDCGVGHGRHRAATSV